MFKRPVRQAGIGQAGVGPRRTELSVIIPVNKKNTV
jgi:hypothetical protein